MPSFFRSIRGRMILAGGFVFFVAAFAALFAISRFVSSAESLGGLVRQSIPIVENARLLDGSVQRFVRLAIEASEAASPLDQRRIQAEAVAAWTETRRLADSLSTLAKEAEDSSVDEIIEALHSQFFRLDTATANFLKAEDAEFQIIHTLRKELEDMRAQTSALKDMAGFDLSMTFDDMLSAETVPQSDVERLVDFDFKRFQYSLEIDLSLAEILHILSILPHAEGASRLEAYQTAYVRHLNNLYRDFGTVTAQATGAPAIVSLLEGWGTGPSNVFDRRREVIVLEQQLIDARRAFRFQSEALIATSHRLAGTLVDSTVDEIMVIETTVDQSRIVTILLLIFAFVSAFLVGWHLVLKGIVRPIAKVETTMGQIAGGDVSAPLPAETNDEVGKMVQALSRLRDYVARVVDAEEAVRQKTNLLQGVLASLNQGVVACDKDLKVIIHNQRFLDLHQYPKELVFEGQDFPELLHHDIARQEYGYSSINDLLDELNDRAESPDPHHYERLRPNGVYLDVRGGPLPDGGFVSAATDISLRKEAERKLAEAHKQITASIEYASIIQRSLLVSNQARFALLGPHFVIWEPRNVVGGDVYWVRSWGGGVLVGLGDCTGHGVPGAFVTLIATSALDLALPMIEPGDVAALMRQVHLNIQSLLGQDMANSLSNDGMDAGFLYLPTGSDQIRYCGANMPLFLVANGAVEQIKGTRYGVGYSDVPETHHYGENILDRTRYDALVMASDGIFDQIGGPRKKGFGKQRLMEVLADASHEPLDRVGEKTLAALTAYQGDCRRLDDVSAIGLSCRADTELLSEKDHA